MPRVRAAAQPAENQKVDRPLPLAAVCVMLQRRRDPEAFKTLTSSLLLGRTVKGFQQHDLARAEWRQERSRLAQACASGQAMLQPSADVDMPAVLRSPYSSARPPSLEPV